MTKKKAILMFGHGGSLNRGCEAIVRSTSTLLKDVCGPQLAIRVSSYAVQQDLDANIPAVDAFMDSGGSWPAHSIARRGYLALEWRLKKNEHRFILNNMRTLGWASRSDLCLAVGGDNYCYDTASWLYPLHRTLRLLCRKMVLWGCSIERERINEAMLKDLRRFDLITARESLTQEALRENGILQVRRYPDPAFTMEEERLPLPNGWREGQMVGVNVSPLIESYEQQRGNVLAASVELVRHILDTTEMDVLLVPHVTWRNSDDRIPLGKIFEALGSSKRVLMMPGDLNAPQIKGYISRCRFFVGARTHATIAAYSAGLPTLVLGYSVKARGIARDLFGDENGLVLPVQELSDARLLVRSFDGLREREKEIRAKLEAILPNYIRTAKDAGWEILRLLSE